MHPAVASFSVALTSAALLASAGKFSQTLQPAAAPMRLAGVLAEISGAAPASASSVYAHNDEQATIYEIDFRSGKTLRSVSLGRPPVIGDFEAIAAQGRTVTLITSAGVIYEANLASRRRATEFGAIDTGIDDACEIEGLAIVDDGYLMSCKRAKRRLVIYRWSPGGGAERVIDMKLKGAVPNADDFRATDLVSDPETETLLVLDSAAGAILEVTMQGEPAGYWRLGGAHPQAEGLALLAGGELLVADEGEAMDGKLRGGVLTLYPPRR